MKLDRWILNFHLENCPPPLGGVIFRVRRGLKYELYLALFVGNEFRLQMWTNVIPTNLHQGETRSSDDCKEGSTSCRQLALLAMVQLRMQVLLCPVWRHSTRNRLPREIALLVPAMLKQAGAEKITFVGGEPTLCPFLDELLIESKRVGLTTCIVSNASGLTEDFLDANANFIDWIGLSIDASNDSLHAKIGRGKRSISSERVATILLKHERRGFDVSSMESVWSSTQWYAATMSMMICLSWFQNSVQSVGRFSKYSPLKDKTTMI